MVKTSPSDKEHQNFRLRWLAYAAQLTVYQANSCKKDDTNTLQKKKIIIIIIITIIIKQNKERNRKQGSYGRKSTI